MGRTRWEGEGDERRGEKWKGKKIGEGRVGMRGRLVNTCERLSAISQIGIFYLQRKGVSKNWMLTAMRDKRT